MTVNGHEMPGRVLQENLGHAGQCRPHARSIVLSLTGGCDTFIVSAITIWNNVLLRTMGPVFIPFFINESYRRANT